MAQGDMNIANQGFPAFRADLNDQLQALVTNSSGATAPATTFPHQWWVDTSTTPNTLRQRNAANTAWIVVGLLNQSNGTFSISIATVTNLQSSLDAKATEQTFTGIAVQGSGGTSDWTQANSSSPWIATKTVTGILATDRPIVDINLSAVAFADVEAVQSDWALVYRVEASAANQLKFYALDEPTENFTVQAKVVR
jgi:hypothetical protein